METKENRPTSAAEISAYLVGGSLLVLTGAFLLGAFCVMGLESHLPPTTVVNPDHTLSEIPGAEHSNLVFALVSASIVSLVISVVGFFATKKKAAIPVWFIFIGGILPGFILYGGWRLVHTGLAAKKELQATKKSKPMGLLGFVIIALVLGVLAAIGFYFLYVAIQ